MTQWEIWKGKPEAMENEHWFVLISSAARIANNERINGLACFSLRGALHPVAVYLDQADGFAAPTSVPCDVMWLLLKSKLHSRIGFVHIDRRPQIRAKLKEFFTL